MDTATAGSIEPISYDARFASAEANVNALIVAESTRLVPSRVFADSLKFVDVTSMVLVGEEAILSDQFSAPHLAVVDLRTGSVVERLGEHGRGANQFIAPAWLRRSGRSAAAVQVYDFDLRRLVTLRRRSHAWEIENPYISFDVDASVLSPVVLENGIVANGLFSDFTLMLLTTRGQPLRRLSAGPPFRADSVPLRNGRRMLNRTYMAVHPGSGRVALLYQYAPRIDVFTTAPAWVATATTPRAPRPVFAIRNRRFHWDEASEMGYTAAQATDRFVYGLYCGCTGNSGPATPSRVHVFRWNGEFVREIELDRVIRAFDVTPDDSRLIGAVVEPVVRLVEWNLPNVG